MNQRLRIAEVGPVATSIPPPRSSSVELVTSLLTEGLVARGHDVTLFATGTSRTSARLHATFARGYGDDASLWPWELCELFNLAAAIERAADFDVIHYQAMYAPMSLAFTRLSPTPVVQTLHHAPRASEVDLWRRYPDAPFVAISRAQARLLTGLNVIATVHHGVDPGSVRLPGAAGRLPGLSRPVYPREGRPRCDRGRSAGRSPSAARGGGKRLLPRGRRAACRWTPDRLRRRGGPRCQGGVARRRSCASLPRTVG